MLTAAHCSGIWNVNPNYVASQYLNPYYRRNYNYYNGYDVQGHTVKSGHTAHPVFAYKHYWYYGAIQKQYKTQTGTKSRYHMANKTVCHYGKNSGQSCGQVTQIFRHTSKVVWSSTRFIQVEGSNLKGCGGDSGGPWYSGGTAYGIHSGGTGGSNCTKRGVVAEFTPIVESLAATASTLLTHY